MEIPTCLPTHHCLFSPATHPPRLSASTLPDHLLSHLSILLSFFLSVHSSFYPPIQSVIWPSLHCHLSFHTSVHSSVIYPPIHSPTHPPIHLSNHLPIHPSIYPNTYPSTHPSTHLSYIYRYTLSIPPSSLLPLPSPSTCPSVPSYFCSSIHGVTLSSFHLHIYVVPVPPTHPPTHPSVNLFGYSSLRPFFFPRCYTRIYLPSVGRPHPALPWAPLESQAHAGHRGPGAE